MRRREENGKIQQKKNEAREGQEKKEKEEHNG